MSTARIMVSMLLPIALAVLVGTRDGLLSLLLDASGVLPPFPSEHNSCSFLLELLTRAGLCNELRLLADMTSAMLTMELRLRAETISIISTKISTLLLALFKDP